MPSDDPFEEDDLFQFKDLFPKVKVDGETIESYGIEYDCNPDGIVLAGQPIGIVVSDNSYDEDI